MALAPILTGYTIYSYTLGDGVDIDDNALYYGDILEATSSHTCDRTAGLVPDYRFYYEKWTNITPPRKWVALKVH